MKAGEYIKNHQVDRNLVYKLIREGFVKKDFSESEMTSAIEQFYKSRDPERITRGNPNKFKTEIPENLPEESLSEAKIKKVVYESKLKKLEYEERIGILVEKEIVRDKVFKFGKTIRDAVLTIPERVSAVYSAKISQEIEKILKQKYPKLSEEIMQSLDQKLFENISRDVWHSESRQVLESIERGAKL